MLPAEVMRQIRRLQLRARRVVQTLLGGEYQSIFKGSGLSFEEVREYQPGDEVRSIDWNVTARMGTPFIKRFVEERELTVFLLVDISGSQQFGSQQEFKRKVATELAALVAFSAIANHDRVGLIAVSDRVERFVPPGKGTKHALRMLRDILFFSPQHPGTSLREGLDYLNQVQSRRAIVFFISDFLDTGFEASFRLAAQKHDLIAVRISDSLEETWPDLGMVQVEDAETGKQLLIDTRSREFREAFQSRRGEQKEEFRKLTRSHQVDLIDVGTDGEHLQALVRFFQLRERRRRRGK